jgi:hypothetical protein
MVHSTTVASRALTDGNAIFRKMLTAVQNDEPRGEQGEAILNRVAMEVNQKLCQMFVSRQSLAVIGAWVASTGLRPLGSNLYCETSRQQA